MLPHRHVSHARGYLELGMVAEAAAELDQITDADSESVEVQSVRLAILQEQQDWRGLRDLAGRLVERMPAEPATWITWAYATRRAESIVAAEKILLTAETRHPKEATIQFNLGCYACQRGDLETARTRVIRAIALDAKFAALAESDADLVPLKGEWSK